MLRSPFRSTRTCRDLRHEPLLSIFGRITRLFNEKTFSDFNSIRTSPRAHVLYSQAKLNIIISYFIVNKDPALMNLVSMYYSCMFRCWNRDHFYPLFTPLITFWAEEFYSHQISPVTFLFSYLVYHVYLL